MTVTRYPKSDVPSLTENSPAQITGDQNNFATGNFDVLRLDTDASRTITGLDGGVTGRQLLIINVGSNNLVLANQSGSSDAANRIICQNSVNLTIEATNDCRLYFDSTTSRWRVVEAYDAKWG